ncbi:response regulator transcription factor [Helicobacter sp. 13S00477-4]|uniref:response regulator transcription factor n=1 Tax=Helicobacter sp. 13S00477-4 TaxID=1905759 RepID=UPI000BA692B6|nr:response regulator transcription factor [Helicobacter sp. 13S00477-4]PAF52610.1 two-component system response regulator [Helicobacter sp. 13S00477-4]
MPNKILLLEDDILLAEIILEFLNEHHFEVIHCSNGVELLDIAYEKNFDIYLFDVMVPEKNGFDVLLTLRNMGKMAPAIFITSLANIENLQQGYKSGCDDYIRKPFKLEELLLRIQTLLKRPFTHRKENFEDFGNGVKFEFETKSVYKDTELLFLPKKEIELLGLFLQNPNQIITKETIFEKLWDYDENPSDMSLRVYIKNLRSLIGKNKIINQRGNGYCYVKS